MKTMVTMPTGRGSIFTKVIEDDIRSTICRLTVFPNTIKLFRLNTFKRDIRVTLFYKISIDTDVSETKKN